MRFFSPSRTQTRPRLIARFMIARFLIAGLWSLAVFVFAMPVAFAGTGTPQVVDSQVQLAQALDASEASPRTESRAGGQQPQGIPDTSGQPANMPLMIGATVGLVMIAGLFLVWKKFSR